jgi:hypothetical protein
MMPPGARKGRTTSHTTMSNSAEYLGFSGLTVYAGNLAVAC